MVRFFCEDTKFFLNKKRLTARWFQDVSISEGKVLGEVAIIFCSDAYLLNLNRKFLNHDFLTDIITFDYCEGDRLEGDIFISIDTVQANAVEFGTSFDNELARVMVHGLLHLIGYDDRTEGQSREMRGKEDFYLSVYNDMT